LIYVGNATDEIEDRFQVTDSYVLEILPNYSLSLFKVAKCVLGSL
jgi:hypothetical protein